jgi:hypothetical protein
MAGDRRNGESSVTLETERAKWPNPWCLWWWYTIPFCNAVFFHSQ